MGLARGYLWTAAVCVALSSVVAFGELPDRFVEYIESTNKTTYVDTGIAASPKYTHMTVRLAITEQTSTQSGVFGAATSDNGNNAAANITYKSKKFRADWTGNGLDTGITPAIGDIYEIDCHYSDVFVGGKRFYKEGDSVMQKGGSNTNNLYLFNYNLSGSPYSNGGVLQRVYGCRIYKESIENDTTYTRTLSANLIPCEKGGVAGFWDSVSGTILYPQNFPLVASAADNPGMKIENGVVFALLTQTKDAANGSLASAGTSWVEIGATATVAPTANAGFQPEYTSTHEGFVQTRTYGGAALSFAMPAWPVEVSVGYTDAAYLPHVSDFAPYIAAASTGDTLRLGPGTYTIARRITLDKGVTLQGAGRDATIIKQLFGTKDRAVNISDLGATIRDLTVSAFTNSINGNGIYMTAGTADTVRVTMDYCYHYNSQQGVGIYMTGGVVTNSLIDHNSCHNGYGGCNGLGVCMDSSNIASPTLLVDSEISDNFRKKAETCGIGVRIQGSSGSNRVLRCRILRNTSYADTRPNFGGNGIFLNSATKSIVEECVIASNGWNGVYINQGTMRNCLIYGHVTTASGREAGVRLSNGYFYNNTVAGNSSLTDYSGLIMMGGTAVNNIIYGNPGVGDLTVSDGTFKTNVVGTVAYLGGTVDGNIAADPLFTDAATADYTIGFDSPAFDAGVAIAGVTRDLVGTVRPKGDAYDIGCYEYVAGGSALQAAIIITQNEYGCGDTAGATSRVVGGSGSYLYAWHLDGALLEGETGDTLSLSTSNIGSGYHTIRLVVTDAVDASLSTEYTYANAWTVKPTTVYVSTTGSDTYPYDTTETAAASLNSAFSALYFSSSVTGTMHIAAGEYALSGALTLSGPVRILGAGRDATVINGAGLDTAVRALTISHAAAVVKDLTIVGCTNNLPGVAINMAGGWVENVRSTRNAAYATGSSENAASGVGIYMTGGVATNCLFDANRQITGYGYAKGAGIYISGGLAVDCEVTNNTKTGKDGRNMAEVMGTGVYIYGSGTILRCNIHGNATTINPADNSYGTGLYLDSSWGSSAAAAENCTIWSNGVQGVYVAHGTLRNSLVWGHATTHASYPAGVMMNSSTQNNAYLYNCTIAGNTAAAAENADLLMVEGTAKNNIAVAATVSGGTSANNLFNVNPNFKNALTGNFRLSAGSPAIDAGDNAALSGLSASRDLDGNDRIKRKVVDIGCYEYNGAGFSISMR